MCLKPIPIKNLNKGINCNENNILYYRDRTSTYIGVPCGHCSECIAVKQMGYVQRLMMESISNEIFMIMYSYKDDMIPKLEINGFQYKYADISDFVLMCKRFDKWRKERNKKHTYPKYPFRYFGVTERGGKRGRPHFHIFILVEKHYFKKTEDIYNYEKELWDIFKDNWCRNVGSTKKPEYKPLFEYHECWQNGQWKRNYDLHWINPGITKEGVADAAWYAMKYALKDHDAEHRRQSALKLNLPKEDYEKAWETIRCRNFASTWFGLNGHVLKKKYRTFKNPFGDESENKTWQKLVLDKKIVNYLKECIKFSMTNKAQYPCWFNPNNGKGFPMADYYVKHFDIIGIDEIKVAKHFYNPDKYDDRDLSQKLAKENKGRKLEILQEREYLDEILNYLNN